MEVNYRHYILFPDGTYKKCNSMAELAYELKYLRVFNEVIILHNVPTSCLNTAVSFIEIVRLQDEGGI